MRRSATIMLIFVAAGALGGLLMSAVPRGNSFVDCGWPRSVWQRYGRDLTTVVDWSFDDDFDLVGRNRLRIIVAVFVTRNFAINVSLGAAAGLIAYLWRRAVRRQPGLLRLAKWGGAAAFVLLAATLCASLIWEAEICFDSNRGLTVCSLNGGCLYYREGGFVSVGRPPPIRLSRAARRFRRRWILPRVRGSLFVRPYAEIPLWPSLAPIGLATVVAFRLDRRRALPGHCACGYNLRGNVSGRCPECGVEVRL